jgi:citrate synthase
VCDCICVPWCEGLSAELRKRAELPAHVIKVLEALPANTHPMTQLTVAIMAMQTESKFAAAYQAGAYNRPLYKPQLRQLSSYFYKDPSLLFLVRS